MTLEDKYKILMQNLADKNTKNIERDDFKPDYYIWINIAKDESTGEVWFIPTHCSIRFIEENLLECSSKYTFMKLEYMALLSSSLIDKIKKTYGYTERLMEFSAVCTYGIWRLETGPLGLANPENRIKYLDSPGYDFEKLKKWFGMHESNFYSCLNPESLTRVLNDKNIKNEDIIEVMEIFCLSIPTLFKIVSPKESGAMEAARKAEQVTMKLGEENTKVLVLKVKVSLFLIALHMGAKIDAPENFALAKIQLKLVQEDERKIKDPRIAPIISALISFANAFYFYKAFKRNCLNTKEYPNKQAAYQQVNNYVKKAQALCGFMFKEDESYKVAKAKTTMLLCKARANRWNVEKKHIEGMREAIIAFTDYRSPRLLMKAHYLYASLKLE